MSNDQQLLKEIRDILIKQNEMLQELLKTGLALNESMDEEMYIRNRETSPIIFDPKEYD